MAKADYNVAERESVTANGGPLTALDRVSETVNETPDAENRAAATAAGVKDAGHIGYEAALAAHEAREDIEALADRRAREYGVNYNAGKFMRELPNRSGGNGYAPGPDNDIVGFDGNASTPA